MWTLPAIRGLIDRRILVNYRVAPDVLARQLPAPFRPLLVNGSGIAGICLIRLKNVHPTFAPAFLGLSSENMAHRIAVEWEHDGEIRQGVYVPRRDTSSWLTHLLGGRLFSGIQHHARFDVHEDADRYSIKIDSDDSRVHLNLEGRVSDDLPDGSVFGTLPEASQFFQNGSLGYSPNAAAGQFDGIELCTSNWDFSPLDVSNVQSSFFEDQDAFPDGAVEFDSAFLMRGIDHEWRGKGTLCAVQ